MQLKFITKCTGIYPKHVTFNFIILGFCGSLDNKVLLEGNVIVNSKLIPNSSYIYYDETLDDKDSTALSLMCDKAISQCVNRATWIFSDGKKFEKD